jgi:hypothetical protein
MTNAVSFINNSCNMVRRSSSSSSSSASKCATQAGDEAALPTPCTADQAGTVAVSVTCRGVLTPADTGQRQRL